MNRTANMGRPGNGQTTSQALVHGTVKPGVELTGGESASIGSIPHESGVALKLRLQELTSELAQTSALLRTEIKARKQLELELHESEERFMAFMDNSPA